MNLISVKDFKKLSREDKNKLCREIGLFPYEICGDDYCPYEDDMVKTYTRLIKVYNRQGGYIEPLRQINEQYQKNDKDIHFEINEFDKLIDAIKTITKFGEWKAEDTAIELTSYTAGEEEDVKQINTVDKYIENAPVYTGFIYRGVGFGYGNRRRRRNFFKQVLKGKINSNKGDGRRNLSWTSSFDCSRVFSFANGEERVIIKCIRNMSSTPIKYLSLFKDEDEIISHSKARWNIIDYRAFTTVNDSILWFVTVVEDIPKWKKKKMDI